MITDAQVHLWEAGRPDRPLAADAALHLPEPMTAERMLLLMDEAGVRRAIISPLYLPAWAPDYALEVAERFPQRFKVMGWFWPDDPKQYAALPRWRDDPRMCSIRLLLRDAGLARTLAEGRLERFWSEAERYGIPVAFMLEHNSASLMAPVAERHPGLKLIVDHFNWPIVPGSREQKISELEALAAHPNVYVKVSSLPRFSTQPPPFDDLQPLIRRVHAAYGARRLMWGSDQSQVIARNLCSYREHVDMIRIGAARYLPAQDIDWMLNGTASGVFNWP